MSPCEFLCCLHHVQTLRSTETPIRIACKDYFFVVKMKERKIQIALGVGAGNRLGLIVTVRLPTFLSLALPQQDGTISSDQSSKRQTRTTVVSVVSSNACSSVFGNVHYACIIVKSRILHVLLFLSYFFFSWTTTGRMACMEENIAWCI